MPSSRNPASSDIISASDEECDTAPCFLHSHERGTKVLGPTKAKKDPLVDLLSRRSPAKLASEKSANLHLSGGSPTKQIWIQSLVESMYEMSLCSLLSHATVQRVTSRAKELTVQRQSGLCILATKRHLSTILAATADNSPLLVKSSGARRWSSMHGVSTFRSLALVVLG